ncbi:MAG: glutamate dehydrogenase, partial [Patescibacteria group bacterium]|nr:glutamate dehydrogenase [Patescibacteria group bacterium]
YKFYKPNQLAATFTGKPVEFGGSLGRTEATGRGGVYVLNELAKHLDKPKEKLKIAIQGMGNVGYFFALLAQKQGYKIVGVSDSKGAIVGEIRDLREVGEYKEKTGSVVGFPGTVTVTNEELLRTECDILVPAAMENVISDYNADKIKAKVIIEMANGPITPEADEILAEKNVIVVPDILANCGGVTVSFFEWEQNMRNEKWEVESVNEKLKAKMVRAFGDVWDMGKEKKVDLRKAAYILAVDKVAKAMINL